MKVDITVKVSGNTKAISVLVLEHLDFRSPLKFRNGEWVGNFPNFPIDADNKLDFALLCAGIPTQDCKATISVKNGDTVKSKESTDIFNPKGWAIIKDNLKLE